MKRDAPHVPVRRLALAGGIVGGTAAAVSTAWVAAAVYLAKLLLTPDHERPDNVLIREVDEQAGTITLGATADTVINGRYGIWFDESRGHLRVGDVVERDEDGGTVTRSLEYVDWGTPHPGPARWDSYYWATDPGEAFGVECHDVGVPSDVGLLPTWHVPANPDVATTRWAVFVHGRGATRHETMRAVPVLHGLGWNVLIPAYRNAPGAPASEDGLYSLGLAEWRDVEATIAYAAERGATEIVLFGWSMGGAVVLQTLDQSPLASLVTKVILDSPVIDWADVITHQAALRHVPGPLALLAQSLIGGKLSRRLVGVLEPLDVARTSWQHRATEISHPMLLIHSVADEFVPVGPSRELATQRPDLIRYEEWTVARHVKEWNTEPERWNRVIEEFLRG